MATSPSFNWPEPDNTDLVKNGALAIRTAVDAIDTSMTDLLGGTTGQVLSKASNTDMDFSWVAQDDSNAIQNAIVDAKGDLIAATAADTPARLAVGADYAFLGSLASESTGLKWNSDWTAWTPTVTNGSIGNGILTARYTRVGKLCIARFQFTLSTTSTVTGDFRFSVPFTPATQSQVCGYGNMFIGGTVTPAIIEIASGDCYVRASSANSTYVATQPLSATTPALWGNNNWIGAQLVYEVA